MPTSTIEILALNPDDWPSIRSLRLQSLADAPEAFASSHLRELEFDEDAWRDRARTSTWFAEADQGHLTGVAGGTQGWSDDLAQRELVGMWVASTHRRRGIAGALVERVSQWARSEGASILSLGVIRGNEGARSFYLRMEFVPTGRTVAVRSDPTRIIEVLERDLGHQ